MEQKLLIIDAHALIHRAFHALPLLMTTNGTPTNALTGFFYIFHNTIRLINPTHIAICFDTPVKTFRKELLTTYQHKRPHLDDNLRVQIPLIKEALDKAGIHRLEKEGFEADDVIGTVSKKSFEHNITSYILTGDKDILQLVNDKVFVIMPQLGTNVKIFDENAVIEKLGVKPNQVADYKALIGDSSDNYNGVKGIGPKTAIKLFTSYKNVEELYKHIEELPENNTKKLLIEQKEAALLTKTIATIVQDVPVEFTINNFVFMGFHNELKEYLLTLEANGLVQKLFPYKKLQQENKHKETEKKSAVTTDQLEMF